MTDTHRTDTHDPHAPPTAGSTHAEAPKSLRSVDRDVPKSSRLADHTTSSSGAALRTEHGMTTIASTVVAKIAGLAVQEIPGVHAMGKGMSRAMGSIRSRVPGGATSATTQGISVEVGETQAAVDIDIVASYGQSIIDTADAIRENVIDRLESLTGLEVVEVNINVDDLHIPSEDDDNNQEGSRVE